MYNSNTKWLSGTNGNIHVAYIIAGPYQNTIQLMKFYHCVNGARSMSSFVHAHVKSNACKRTDNSASIKRAFTLSGTLRDLVNG